MRTVNERADVIPRIAEVFREFGYEGATLSRITEILTDGAKPSPREAAAEKKPRTRKPKTETASEAAAE